MMSFPISTGPATGSLQAPGTHRLVPDPHATGSVNAILAPPPSRSSAQIRPP